MLYSPPPPRFIIYTYSSAPLVVVQRQLHLTLDIPPRCLSIVIWQFSSDTSEYDFAQFFFKFLKKNAVLGVSGILARAIKHTKFWSPFSSTLYKIVISPNFLFFLELKPKPCDSSPCKNEGICSNEGGSFSCKCVGFYQGKTCEGESDRCQMLVGLNIQIHSII